MSLSTASVSIRAHAKINLDLRVLGMRADGFHELRTVFQAIALHDTICCVPRAGPFAIECSTAGVPLDHTNLIWRAAATLWRSLRRSGSVRDVVVQLDKRIPLQAGLGGGSADAAATLMALARLWRLRIKPSQFTDIAAHIGSDVPFFLSGGTALGLGRGEEIYPLADLPPHWIVLLIPGFGVSTSEAYGWYDSEPELSRAPREPQHVPGPWPSRAAQMINDLEAPIARHHPEIDQMKAALRRAGALAASMSGSGSTVFGLFQKRREAVAAVDRLKGTGWQVLLTESLDRGEYARRAKPRTGRADVRLRTSRTRAAVVKRSA
ncbi:MAG TPA: 4-(cytidine 5'-diphospho)-2-C-methyl-D-erythritol kinase [Vicinamibacterales bacterium]|jgi:4-diphosphocytidyl-2-C-methyl-D-erythritol kinase|nr:4-(cytidine 5'-diphospho)-2-C-methyl-D-erythritol kinase [Vicinamibacterales bacterium]